MTFSGVNSSLNAFSAKNLRLSTNWRMRATASSFLMWKGSTASGTAPFATCSLTPKTLRHQWQHAFVGRDVARARSEDRALELVVSCAETELLFDAFALPFVAAERADEQVG